MGRNYLNRLFSKENTQMANKQMKRCSTLLIIREMQRKSKDLTAITMAIIKKPTNSKHWRGGKERGTPLHGWWECDLIQTQPLWRFLKKLGIHLLCNPVIWYILGIYPESLKRHMYPNTHSSTIFNI